MIITPQTSSAIIECDCPMSEREKRRVLADLQAIGIRAVILPMGLTVAGMASCEIEGDE